MTSKQGNRVAICIGLGVAALLAACSPDPAPVTELPGQEVTPPGKGTATAPGSDIGTSLRTTALHWGPLDLQEWTHDAAGQWIRYVSQWTWVEGSAQVRRLTYEFLYGQDGRLERLNVSDGNRLVSYVDYHYAQKQLTECNEYSATGTLVASYRYVFDANQLHEQTETYYANAPRQVRKLFTYDAKGNLTEMSESIRVEGANSFVPTSRLQYDQYDNRPALPTQSIETFPYLPGVRFRVNNPGGKRILDANGQTLLVAEQYAYTFGADGQPTSQTISGAGGSRTGQFQYSPW